MANLAKHEQRSRLALAVSHREGPRGMPHNAQDFSGLSGTKAASRQCFIRENWEYMPARKIARAEALSTSFQGVPVFDNDLKAGQFALTLG